MYDRKLCAWHSLGDRAATPSLCWLRRETDPFGLWHRGVLFHKGWLRALEECPPPGRQPLLPLPVRAQRLCSQDARLVNPVPCPSPAGAASFWKAGLCGVGGAQCPRDVSASRAGGWPARPGVWVGCSEDVPAILGDGPEAATGWSEDRTAAAVLLPAVEVSARCRVSGPRPFVCAVSLAASPFPPLCPSSARARRLGPGDSPCD